MSEASVYFWLTISLCIFVGTLFFASRKKSVVKKGITGYYQMTCASLFIWLFSSLFLFAGLEPNLAHRVAMWRYVGIAFMPVFTTLHIWRQFSSKNVSPRRLFFLLLPPAFSSVLAVTNDYTGFFISGYEARKSGFAYQFVFNYSWGFYLHCVFSYIAILIGVFLLLRIFFRVPRHMRKTINLMACAVGVTVLSNAVVLFSGVNFPYDITLIGSVLTLCLFYLALNITRSASIVITSREYVWENLSSMILVLDEDGLILDFNKSGDMKKLSLSLPEFMEPYREFRKRWIASGKGVVSKHDDNIVTFSDNAVETHYRIRTHEITEGEQRLGSLVEISEITEIYTLLRYMEDSSQYDYLTGLYNRNAFIKTAPEMCRPEDLPLLVIIGDVNELKAVNDQKGHVVGDRLIKTLASILSECAPPEAFVARIGGDEFILLVPGASEELGEKYVKCVNDRCARASDEAFGTPSISIGFSVLENESRTLHDVIEEADKNMYMSKRRRAEGSRRRYNVSFET